MVTFINLYRCLICNENEKKWAENSLNPILNDVYKTKNAAIRVY